MQKNAKLEPLDSKFNAFHLEVAVHQERCAFLLDHLDIDYPAMGLLRHLNDELLKLIELQDSN